MHIPISTSCGIIGCFKKVRKCDITGLTCQCCEIMTCVPNWPAERVQINRRSKLSLHREDKNIIHLSRVSYVFIGETINIGIY